MQIRCIVEFFFTNIRNKENNWFINFRKILYVSQDIYKIKLKLERQELTFFLLLWGLIKREIHKYLSFLILEIILEAILEFEKREDW